MTDLIKLAVKHGATYVEMANALVFSTTNGELEAFATALLAEKQAEIDALQDALKPFAKFACDTPCGCFNCKAKEVLK